MFKFINVPVASIQFHFDSFLSFKVLKPKANLKFFISVFFWTDQNYFEMKQKLLISSEKFNWYQFESRDESSLMIHFGTSDISDIISFRSINRNPHPLSTPYFHTEFGFSWIYLWIALRFEIISTKVNFKNSTIGYFYARDCFMTVKFYLVT